MRSKIVSNKVFSRLLILTVVSLPLFAQDGFNFADFSSVSGLTLNGSAAQSGTVLRLTNNGASETASTWFNTQQKVGSGFTTTFKFQISGNKAADGFAFVIQNSSLGALGAGGGALGYGSIANSLAVEFDIFQDGSPFNDPNNNHVAVQSCGTAANNAFHLSSCSLSPATTAPITLADGSAHTAVIEYLPGTLTLSLDGTQVLSVPVNLSSTLNLNGGKAWVGFTAATGGSTSTQDILSWSYSSLADVYQIGYAANLPVGFSNINITNAGAEGGSDPGGDICANVYVFAEDQQLIECCACRMTPNHLKTFSTTELIANTLTPGVPLGITIGLVATANPTGGACDASSIDPAALAPGMRAWDTVIHSAPGGGFAVTEDHFLSAPLSTSELAKMTSFCGFIEANGSFFGICKTCANGAAGATKQ
jgi:hypothetical protein